jgi:hypothetical protein
MKTVRAAARGRERDEMRLAPVEDRAEPVIRITSPTHLLLTRSDGNELREARLEGRDDVGPIILDISDIYTLTSAAADAFICRWLLAARQQREVSLIVATPLLEVIEEVDNALRLAHLTALWVKSSWNVRDQEAQVIGERPDGRDPLLELIQERPGRTAMEYGEELGLAQSAALNRLATLTKRGLVYRIAPGGRAPARFQLPVRLPRPWRHGQKTSNGVPKKAT